jgi:DNA-binding beta-propeller fold protein YncE
MIRLRVVLLLLVAVVHAASAHAERIFVSLQNGTVQSFDISLGSAAAIEASAQTFANQALARPQGLAFNTSGDLFVANYDTSTVAGFASDGTYLPGSSIPSTNVQNPFGIAFDASGNLFVANVTGGSVSKFNAAGTYQGAISSNLSSPTGVAVDTSGNLHVANAGDNTISKFDAAGNYLAAGSISGNLDSPYGLAFDAAGNLYAANVNSNSISKFGPSGNFMSTIADGSLNVPVGLAFDASGNLYAANYFGQTISKFDSTGTFLMNWSTAAGPRFLAFQPVPEPSSWAVGIAVLTSGGHWVWRRRTRA